MINSLKIKKNKDVFIIHLFLLFVLMLWMIPEVYMFMMAFRFPDQIFDPKIFVWPMTLDNLITVISENPLHIFFFNTIIITVCTVILVLVVSSIFAFAVSVLRLKYSVFMYSIILVTLMVPISSLVLPLTILLKNFGWTNRYIGLIFPYVALGVPFAVVVLKGFLDNTPKDLFEATRIDGCNALQMYWYVGLPLIRPALTFVAIWQFITTWNEFFLALVIMTENEMKTLTIIPMQYSGFYMANPGALFAILVIVAIPLIIIYVIVQRAFVQGLTQGAMKG